MKYLVVDLDGKYEPRVLEGSYMLSSHFQVDEFACGDGSDVLCYSSETLLLLEMIHDKIANKVGKRVPLYVSSAFRSPAYSKAVGGYEDDQHVVGGAVDIMTPTGLTTSQFAEIVLDVVGFMSGVGVSLDTLFVHVDNRKSHGRWSYNGDNYDFKGK